MLCGSADENQRWIATALLAGHFQCWPFCIPGKPSSRSAHSLTCAGLRAPDRTENDRSCSPIRPAALMAFGLVDGSTRPLHVRLSNQWSRPAASRRRCPRRTLARPKTKHGVSVSCAPLVVTCWPQLRAAFGGFDGTRQVPLR